MGSWALGLLGTAAAVLFGVSGIAAQQQTPAGLSPFSQTKAEALLADKLPCLGCHAINSRGGRIGPDLSGVGARLDADAIRRQIEHPRGIMPRVMLPSPTLDLIVAYLSAQRTPARAAAMPPPTRAVTDTGTRAGQLYQTHCAACHGARGKGDGPNAVNLDRPPARHADAREMGKRTDDRLFDAIFAGGYILGGSARMPAYGSTLSADDIRALVGYIRELCRCRQPKWADAEG